MSSAEFFTILSYVFSNVTSTDEKRSQSYQEVQQTIPACPADDSRGRSFTAQGPPEYKGKDILEDPDLLWLDDADWDEDRVKAAEMRISDQGDNAPQFWREKYVREANKYWHIFYTQTTSTRTGTICTLYSQNYFKNRTQHHMMVEFAYWRSGVA
jgi:hypothetical protein